MSRRVEEVAWRGFVTHGGEVIAWPTLLADHNDFHATFGTTDSDFLARWRQWGTRAKVDYDDGTPDKAKEIVERWLRRE